MKRGSTRRTFLKSALTAPVLLAGAPRLGAGPALAHGVGSIGPSTTTDPYLIPSLPGVRTVSILTVGDSVDGYRMVGIPDGLGAFNTRHHDFDLMMNHELGGTSGIVRAHGSRGAFVSRWTIDRHTLKVVQGEDFTPSPQKVFTWDPMSKTYVSGTTVWQRLCSSDLPRRGAFHHDGKGTRERIYMNGEEVQQNGRAWARIATGPHAGEAWELPRFGKISYENAVASPYPQDKTVVMLTDDGALGTAPVATSFPSEVYVYVGTKQRRGHPIEQAGLTNGTLYGLQVAVNGTPIQEESNAFGLGDATTGFVGKGRFSLFNFGDVSSFTSQQLEEASIAAGIMRFQRDEDGAWDPRYPHRDDFYFVTTASLTNNCRLWRLRFDDVERPHKGGTIEILLKGDEGHGMLDNVTMDRYGRILMDEDPGNTPREGKIWLYQVATGEFVQVAQHDPRFFTATVPPGAMFLTQDEESSGIIDAEHILGRGWFLLDVQVHKANPDPELVEGGQLLAMFVDPRIGAEPRRRDRDDDHDDHHHDHDDD